MPSSSTSSGSIPRISDAFSPSVNALRLVAFAMLCFGLTPAASQQRERTHTTLATGRVMHVRPTDSVSVPGATVVLHRVATDAQGPIDSVVTDRRGRFRLTFQRDTSALFLVSSRYSGIEYFSAPIRLDPGSLGRDVILSVYDTSSTTPVRPTARHIVVSRPGAEGMRGALELVFLANEGTATRVPRDSLSATWSMALPEGIAGFDATGGDVSPQSFTVRDDTLFLAATIAPGERQLVYQYGLPVRSRIAIPVAPGTETVNLLLEEADARVESPGMTPADTQVIEGRTYRRWTGSGVAGVPVVIRFSDPARMSRTALIALVGTLGAAVLLLLAFALRRPAARHVAASPSPAALIDALARLDAIHQPRESLSVEARERFESEQARLRALLNAALAERRQRR